jgi:hypothetical protein
MRILAISRLTITQKTRRSVRTRQRRDPPHPLDPLYPALLDALSGRKIDVARATVQ